MVKHKVNENREEQISSLQFKEVESGIENKNVLILNITFGLTSSDICFMYNVRGVNTKSIVTMCAIPEINTNRSSKPLFITALSLVLVAFFLLGIMAITFDRHYTKVAPNCAICQLKICINGVEDLFTLNVLNASEYLCTSKDKFWNKFGFIPSSKTRAPPLFVFT